MKIMTLLSGAAKEFYFGKQRKLPWLKLKFINLFGKSVGRLLPATAHDYLKMQKRAYETAASAARVRPGAVVGDIVAASDWKLHNEYPDYESFILKFVPNDASWIALEYGCGPGRNIENWTKRFKRIDGVDISSRNLENARIFLSSILAPEKQPKLFLTSGQGVGDAPRDAYDFAFSVICLQHICVHSVRFSILKDLFATLKPGGRLAFQMAFSAGELANTVPYGTDFVSAGVTNGMCDVRVESATQIEADLKAIGFTNLETMVRSVPQEMSGVFKQWIFVNAQKPAGTGLVSKVNSNR